MANQEHGKWLKPKRRWPATFPDYTPVLLQRIRILPLSWLSLSLSKRLLLVVLSYGLGITGLWLLFPLSDNGATMFLPIVSSCWLFRYRGLLISMILNGLAFQLTYIFLLRGMLPDQAFVIGGIIGFGTSLGLGFVVCWLRTTVDLMQIARQQAVAAEQAHLLASLKESQAMLAYEQEHRMNTLKDQFLLNVSHELRTPLTVLGGYLDLLDEHYEHLDAAGRTRALREALKSREELSNLVDRVLDATRVAGDLPSIKSEIIDIYPFLQEVLERLVPLYVQDYAVRLHIPEQIMVRADPQFLRQVLSNLLSNISKYVPAQTEIRIEAAQADPSSPVCLSIQDAGPGIPVEELPLLFGKFVRLKRDLTSATPGTGLGLYICKQLIEAMGGRIWVESPACEGTGSRFCLALLPFSSSNENDA